MGTSIIPPYVSLDILRVTVDAKVKQSHYRIGQTLMVPEG
jgi:hypothetical protein